MTVIQTLINGLGNIGAFYDIDEKSSDTVRTHLRAIAENESYEIVALVEPDANKWSAVQKYCGLDKDKFFRSIDELPNDLKIDLSVFAATPHDRHKNLQILQKHEVKFCVFEKPLANTLGDAEKIIKFCNQNSMQALINFHRRYDEKLLSFKELLPKDEMPKTIVVHYTKGIKNYGSHAIDLLMDYFGDVAAVQAVSANDVDDPLIDGVLHFENGVIAHLVSHETNYDLFEFEFFYKDKKFTLGQGTTQQWVQQTHKNLIYEGYSHLGDFEFISAPQKVSGMIGLYDDISCYFNNPKHILKGCDLQQAKKGMVIIENLLKSASDKRFIKT